MKVCDVPYDVDFYWKGERYVQWMKAKKVKSRAICYKKKDPAGKHYDFPAGRIVKPVVNNLNRREKEHRL